MLELSLSPQKRVKIFIWFIFAAFLGESNHADPKSPHKHPHQLNKNHIYDVIIVGAGMSGVTAASELYAVGYRNFLIVEANSRIGGRIYTHSLLGENKDTQRIEFGANWIHGYTKNPLFKFVLNYHMNGTSNEDTMVLKLQKQIKYEGNKKTSEGKALDVTEDFITEQTLFKKLLNNIDSRKYSKTEDSKDISLATLLKKHNWTTNGDRLKKLVEYFVVDCNMGMPPKVISGGLLKSHYFSKTKVISETTEKDQYFITDKRGVSHLLETMIDKNFGRKYILLDTPITHINQFNKSVQLLSSSLFTSQSFRAKYVLTTTSVGVLTKGRIKFTPTLPNNYTRILNKIGMGLYTKVFVKYPCRFWHNKSYILMYDDEDRTYFKFWQHLPNQNERLCSNNTIDSTKNQYSLILTTLVGEDTFWLLNKTKSEIMSQIYAVTKQAYGPKIPRPMDIYWYDWYGDKNFGGSFPTHLKGISHNDIAALKTNIGRLFFAGDWQSEHYTGCLHGAYFSAYDRTQDIIQALNNQWDIQDSNKMNRHLVDMCLRNSDSLC